VIQAMPGHRQYPNAHEESGEGSTVKKFFASYRYCKPWENSEKEAVLAVDRRT
jgi:hypothetical protein